MPTVGVVSLGAMGSAVADALGRGGPALFEAMPEIYAALDTTPAATRAPDEVATRVTLEQLLENMREA